MLPASQPIQRGCEMTVRDVQAPSSAEPTLEHRVAKVFGLEGDAWMRHANPCSVWSRFSCVSLLALAVWSRAWIGWWSIAPIAAAVVWMVVNPRVFGVPASTRNWASKGVFGERLWTNRHEVPVPEQFRSRVPDLANLLSSIGVLSLIYGLVVLEVWPVVAGIFVVPLAKLWYIDRMVLLFEDMKHGHPEYARWEHD